MLSYETESICLRKHSAQQILAVLNAAGYVNGQVFDGNQLTWLRESGCLLIQAQTNPEV